MKWKHEMTKFKSFFQNLIKPFTSNSTRDQNEVDLERIAEQEQKHFSFEALVKATKNFHPSQKLGEGGFGPVFKGKLDDGREIAVKRLSQSSSQGKTQFQNEAKLLVRVQHKNVVSLLGYCVIDTEKLLVYEYVANQSLDKLLFKADRRDMLDWKRRHDVIAGVAKGLLYLHEEAPCCIIHRDIKASNILLDDRWIPKIADFGLARLFSDDQTHVNTHIAGTSGYMAPEYLMQGILSKKADVFSFGVVVLELVSGQRNSAFNRDPDSQNLLEWAKLGDVGVIATEICYMQPSSVILMAHKLYKKQRSIEVMDPTLVSSADLDQIAICIQLGLLCVQSDPQSRPDMDRVVVILSRKPSNLEEPTRPGLPGRRYRRYHRATASTVTGTSDVSSSQSSGSTYTQTVSTSGLTSTGPDPHGKRPMKD